MKGVLSNAEQHPFSVEQGDWQHAGAGLGPLGSLKQGHFCVHLGFWGGCCGFFFFFPSLEAHGCSLSLCGLWGGCEHTGLLLSAAGTRNCSGMGKAQGAVCHPAGLVSVCFCTGRVEG